MMKLDDSKITRFKVSKEFCENKRINSIDFSQDGRHLITSSDDDIIALYDCEKGNRKREILSKKYGVNLIKYTHATNTALHTSTKENHTIRYLSLHDNKYLRYFSGHEDQVVTLCMSPADDCFLSGSLDQTIRLWDLKSEKTVAKLNFQGLPIANYDPEGLIFAVGINSEIIKFFDLRHYEKGPFSTIRMSKPPPDLCWKSLKFSPNGNQLLITTNCEEIFILDAFTAQPLHRLNNNLNGSIPVPVEYPSDATYTPDSQYIMSGSADGSLHIYNASKGSKVIVLRPERRNPDPVQCVKFNPKYMLLASACSRLSFWVPPIEE